MCVLVVKDFPVFFFGGIFLDSAPRLKTGKSSLKICGGKVSAPGIEQFGVRFPEKSSVATLFVKGGGEEVK